MSRRTPRSIVALAFAVLAAVALSRPAQASGGSGGDEGTPIMPPGLEDVGVVEHLDGPTPMDAQFKDETGKAVRFGSLFDGKRPVVLTLAYHTCPTVCSMVLSQTVESLKNVGWTVGKEYDAVTLSFDPRETMEKTAAKRLSILSQYGRPEAAKGWHFLLGDETNIRRVTEAVGFKYHYDAHDQQYAHPTVIMLLKPDGHVARYLYGLEYNPNDVRLGLLEASEGRSISTIERVLLYCYHYDPQGGKYVLVATQVMKIGGGICGLALAAFLFAMFRHERRKSRAAGAGSGGSGDRPGGPPNLQSKPKPSQPQERVA
jgi:protein SCO1/2